MSRHDRTPYTPPLPSTRDAETEVIFSIACRLHSAGAQLRHISDLLRAYGYQDHSGRVFAIAISARDAAAALGGWQIVKPPAPCEAEDEWWEHKTLSRLSVVW